MWIILAKALGTAAFIVLLGEVAKRSTWLAAVLVALPLATILTVLNIAIDTKDGGGPAVANAFATSTFLLVWPGLTFFLVLPLLQKLGLTFWWAFAIAVVATFAATWGFTLAYRALGLKI
jgi:hypothetical protein